MKLPEQRLPPPGRDLTPLSSGQWVYQTLSSRQRPPKGVDLKEGEKAWPGLGSKVDVLELSSGLGADSGDGAGLAKGMGALRVE